jgi:hypothetical protein
MYGGVVKEGVAVVRLSGRRELGFDSDRGRFVFSYFMFCRPHHTHHTLIILPAAPRCFATFTACDSSHLTFATVTYMT